MLPVKYTSKAEKYFKKLKDKPLKKHFFHAILALREDPYIGESKTGDLRGIYSLDIHHKGNNYELAYQIDTTETGDILVVILAGTRENFYEELKRYMETL